jgi:cytochrome bd ubiquinol oxidase subunit I
VEAFRISFRLAALIGLASSVMVVAAGDAQGRYLREVQPMAAAASEALWETSDPAPFTAVAIFDADGKNEVWSLKVPHALSMLYYLKPEGEVEGINDLQEDYAALYGPGNYIPPVPLVFWMFRIMVGLGFLMVALTLLALYIPMRKWPERWVRWLKWSTWIILLPYLANTSGWILTETGRQPWIVHGLLKTENAVSPNLTAGMVLASLLGFTLVYTILMVADIYLLRKYAVTGLSATDGEASAPAASGGIRDSQEN